MVMKVFSSYDRTAETYGSLICAPTVGLARRGFEEAVRNPQSTLHRYADDYALFEIGEFDSTTGLLKPLIPAREICKAAAVKMAQELAAKKGE